MASSSGGRKKRLVSSLDGEVLERLSMKLNPRMLMKDYQTLAGRLKYTYEYIRNFAREQNPTLTLLQHWWSSKRGKAKTVSVLIEHLSEMERDDAVDLLRPYEYYSSHEAAEYDENYENPVITVTADFNRNIGFPGRENEYHQNAGELGACKPATPVQYIRFPGPEYEQNQRANFSGNFGHDRQWTMWRRDEQQRRMVWPNGAHSDDDELFSSERQFQMPQHSSGMQKPVVGNPQYLSDSPPGLARDTFETFDNNSLSEEPGFLDGFPGSRRDIRIHGPPRPNNLDGSSTSSVDFAYYHGTQRDPQGLFKGERMTRDYGDPRRYSEQHRSDFDPGYIQSDYGPIERLPVAGGHDLTFAADKVALVIGNQDYAHRKLQGLQYPEQDAADVAAALTQLNFKVVSLINLTHLEMRTAMLAFCCLLGRGVYGVVYYAGHGYEDCGENFLLPVDSDLNYKRDESLRTQEILETMEECQTSLNLLIIDACRVSLPNKSGITVPRIKRNVKSNNIFAYSCCSQQESLEEPNCRNGMYCSHLLRRLRENRRIENILMDVATDFARTYDLKQRPCLETDCTMDFRLTDPIHAGLLPEEFVERCRRWHEANRHPQQFTLDQSDLQFTFTFHGSFCNVLCVTVTATRKTERPITQLYIKLTPKEPLRCLEKDMVDFEHGSSHSVHTFEIINIQKLYKLQEPLILSVKAMFKVDGKLASYDKDIDLGWPLVSSVMCLWDNWLLGDRCKTTAV